MLRLLERDIGQEKVRNANVPECAAVHDTKEMAATMHLERRDDAEVAIFGYKCKFL